MTTSPITRTTAHEGSVDGFASTCECGMTLTHTDRGSLEADVAAHLDYHERRAAEARVVDFARRNSNRALI